MKRNSIQDLVLVFGVVTSMLTIWSYIDLRNSKITSNKQSKELNNKIDRILSKVGG